MTVGQADWSGRTPAQRRRFLERRAGRNRRDQFTGLLWSANETTLRSFVAGLANVVGPFVGTAQRSFPSLGVTIPARGVAGRWYAIYRAAEEIERPAGVNVATARPSLEVCGAWLGDG